MNLISTIVVAALACVGCEATAASPATPPPSTTGPVTLQDIDFQIKITKEAIEKYKNLVYVFDQKAQSLLPHDFLGYREAEGLSQQCQTIADDLSNHLQQLEEQRKAIEKKSGAPVTSEQL
jgi:hypothetical protein